MSLYPTLIACSLLLVSQTSGQSFCDGHIDNGLTCFNEPQGCTTEAECEMTMTSKAIPNANATKFTLSAKSEGWVAIGLSGDQMMGNDDVIMCAWNGTAVQLLERYNDGRTNQEKTNPSIGDRVRLESQSNVNGVISCEFDRDNIIEDQQHFALTENTAQFYGLFGRGPVASDDMPNQHQQNPWISNTTIIFDGGVSIARVPSPSMSPPTTQPTTTAGSTHTTSKSIVLHLILASMMMVALAIDII